MKKEINAPVAIAIAAAFLIALCVGLYFKFFYQPTLDPKVLGESRAGIARTQDRLRQAGIGGPGGPPHAQPAPPPGPAGVNPNAGPR
jgi:hypothetical protein